jgi:exopolyphosphatase/guanosine-5'-triphosphate,3'-diphosphate pyrophosphatase
MRLAAIDIGTNSIHMIVVDVRPDLSFVVVDREKEMVRLGAGGLGGKALATSARAAAIEALVRFKQLAESRRVDEIVAGATSAVREARDGGDFLNEVAERTGIRPRVISGTEEARLVHFAAVYGVEASSGRTVVVDVGGGSTEITHGTATEAPLARSFSLGALRLTDRFVHSDPLDREHERKMVKHIEAAVDEFARQIATAGFERVIATSGTAVSLAQVALRGRSLFNGDTVHHRRVSAKELHRARKQVVALDMTARLKLPGLDARRADLIVAGAILLDTLVQRLGAREVIFSDLALREGLVLDFIHRNSSRIARIDRFPDIRRRSVIELAERCRWYPEHSEQVARLALSLFDQTRGLHRLSDRVREWVEFAGLLHDIGGHIAYVGHHKHSYYLVRNGGLRGFEPEEIEAIALMARYHRRGRPRKSHSALSSLSPGARRAVQVGAAVLRLAESLDRSHSQVIDELELQEATDRFRLVVRAHGPVELERWAAGRQTAAMERLLGRPLVIQPAEAEADADPPARPAPAPATRRRRQTTTTSAKHGASSRR